MQAIKVSETTAVRRRVPVTLVDDTDGKTPKTGITLIAGDMKICKNGATEANHAGTLYESAGGDYYYEFAAAEVDTLGVLRGRIVKTACRTFRIACQVVAYDPYATPATTPVNFSILAIDGTGKVTTTNPGSGLDATATRAALGMSSPNLDTQLTGISTKTNNLPASPAAVGDIMKVSAGTGANQIQLTAGLVTSTNAGTGLDATATRAALGLSTANLDTQLSAINVKTTNLPALPAAVGSIMKTETGTGANQMLLTAGQVTSTNAGSGLDAASTRAALGLASPNLDTQLGGINAKTTNLPASPAAVGSIMKVDSGSGANQIQLTAGLVTSTNAGSGLDAPGTRAALGMASPNLDTQLGNINSKTTNLPASPAAVGSIMKLENGSGANQILLTSGLVTSTNAGSGLDANGIRAALGMSTANLDAQLNALPTNPELVTALASADDAMLAALGSYPLKRNVAGQKVFLLMADAADPRVGKAGVPTVLKSLDGGGSWSATAGMVVEIGSGGSWFYPTAADINGEAVVYQASLAGAVTRFVPFYTHP